MESPYILAETDDYAVVFKPPRMHSAPLHGEGDTLFDWYAKLFPSITELCGRKKGEGGLLHRLDFETHGLVLFAKNQPSLDALLAMQEQGKFIKEYTAICQKRDAALSSVPLSGFPPPPEVSLNESFIIESCFRPFGLGRKQVRPVTGISKKESSGSYQTEVVSVMQNEHYVFTLRLKKGFRHQIRCHLAWIGYPVINDSLYSKAQAEQSANAFLALRSHGLIFPDPKTDIPKEYRIEPLEISPHSL